MTDLDRSEYGEIYHRTFGKAAKRTACREGWKRWQKVLASNLKAIVLHPPDAPIFAPDPADYWAFVALGPLTFLTRINAALLPQLPEMWLKFAGDKPAAKFLANCGQNPRARARGFIQNSLVDGYVIDLRRLLSSAHHTACQAPAGL